MKIGEEKEEKKPEEVRNKIYLTQSYAFIIKLVFQNHTT